jgi:hypothetical protein
MRVSRAGRAPAYSWRSDMRPGISCSAGRISGSGNSARSRSVTANSPSTAVVTFWRAHAGSFALRPAASRNAEARSVCSHGRSTSVRPKCPYADVAV